MNQKNYTSNEDFDDGVELSDIFSKLKQEREDYINGDEEYKQKYWDSYVCTMWWYNERGTSLPIFMEKLRKFYEGVDGNIDRFLPGTMRAIEDEGFTGEIEDIFTLDTQAKEYLNSIGYIQKESTKRKVIKIVGNQETQEILGENISFEELVERIGDLYYDSLSSFLNILSEYVYNEKMILLLKEASENINRAWDICKKPTLEFLEEIENSGCNVELKHTSEVKGLKLNNDELARSISHLQHYDLVVFLEKLSSKIEKDGKADKGRGRIKLSNELFACADKLKQASKL